MQLLTELAGKKLKTTTKEGLDLADVEEKKEFAELKAEIAPLPKLMQEVIGDKVEEVTASTRLADSPCVLPTSEHGWSAHRGCIMKPQALRDTPLTSDQAPQ